MVYFYATILALSCKEKNFKVWKYNIKNKILHENQRQTE